MAVPRVQTAREENQRCLCWWAPMMLQRTLGNSGQPRQPSVCSVTAEENNNIIVQAVCSSKPPSELSHCLHFTDMHWNIRVVFCWFLCFLGQLPHGWHWAVKWQGLDLMSLVGSLRSSPLAVQRLCVQNKWKKTLCQGNTLSLVTLSAVPVLQPCRYVCDAQ